MEIKNLNQLKKTLQPGVRFEVISHCRTECIGQIRQVSVANTQGFYSIIADDPDAKINFSNNCRGPVLWWSKAPFWEFTNGVCSLYSSDSSRADNELIMSFRIVA